MWVVQMVGVAGLRKARKVCEWDVRRTSGRRTEVRGEVEPDG